MTTAPSSRRPPELSRRRLLTAVSATALAAVAPLPNPAFAAPMGVDEFLKLSQAMTGKDDLDRDIAAAILRAFEAAGHADALAELSPTHTEGDVANEVVAVWYSGLSPVREATEVLTYTEARLWDAMTYTKPMGYCGGAMGYWSDPPDA